jgi:hypothetical protein
MQKDAYFVQMFRTSNVALKPVFHTPIILSMRSRAIAQCIFVFGILLPVCSAPGFGQVPPCIQHLSPYPQLADEISQMRAEAGPAKIEIEDVKFDGPVHLPHAALEELVKSVKLLELDANSDWVPAIEEIISSAWQKQGYFRVEVHAKPQLISSDSTYQRYSVTIHVTEGLQYRLGDIQFVPAKPDLPADAFVFPVKTLRKLFDIREGELFNVDKIRSGIQAMTKLYGSKGYIEFTAAPEFSESDSDERVSVVLRLSESVQYRVENVEVVGLNPRMENILRSTIKVGEIFNTRLLDDFYEKYKINLPEGTRPETMASMDRNIKNGTVSLRFDFRTCPEHGN